MIRNLQRHVSSSRLALVRVFVWETDAHSAALARHLHRAGHPFVARSLPAPPTRTVRGERGQLFELFTLPLDLGDAVAHLQSEGLRKRLEVTLDLTELPLLLVVRKGRPSDPSQPERDFQPFLDLLPTWRPDVSATDGAPPAPAGAVVAQLLDDALAFSSVLVD